LERRPVGTGEGQGLKGLKCATLDTYSAKRFGKSSSRSRRKAAKRGKLMVVKISIKMGSKSLEIRETFQVSVGPKD